MKWKLSPESETSARTSGQGEIATRGGRSRRSLVVIDDTESSLSLVQWVGELVAGTGRELVLLHIMPQDKFDFRQQSINSTPILRREGGYFIDQAIDSETRTAQAFGRLALDDLNCPFISVGEVGSVVPTVLAKAKRYRCDHIFITSHPSRWRGSQPFDKTVRQIATAFDGMVTVAKDSGSDLDINTAIEERTKTRRPSDTDSRPLPTTDNRPAVKRESH